MAKQSLRLIGCGAFLFFPGGALANEGGAPAIDSGAVAWTLTATAMVMLMTLPGLALFYGGLSRSKNVLSTIMYSYVSIALVSVVWVLWGYSIAFGDDIGGVVGSLAHVGLRGVPLPGMEAPPNALLGLAIPDTLFVAFQGAFAVIAVALISGSFAERFGFLPFAVFSILWVSIIYAPVAHWVWGGGWLARIGALDFAGGSVVHIAAGVSGLAIAMYIGKRKGYGKELIIPHNVPMVITGSGLLWFGWFGFNAGSALAADGLAAIAFLVTHLAASAAALGWLVVEWRHGGAPTAVGVSSGAVSGLVAITPAAGFVTPLGALVIGLVAGGLCYFAVYYKHRLGYDDALDAFGIHAVGGAWGAVATGLFASRSVTGPTGAYGLFEGNTSQLFIQLGAVIATFIYCYVGSMVIIKLVDMVIPVRPDEEAEIGGLDQSQHRESAYN